MITYALILVAVSVFGCSDPSSTSSTTLRVTSTTTTTTTDRSWFAVKPLNSSVVFSSNEFSENITNTCEDAISISVSVEAGNSGFNCDLYISFNGTTVNQNTILYSSSGISGTNICTVSAVLMPNQVATVGGNVAPYGGSLINPTVSQFSTSPRCVQKVGDKEQTNPLPALIPITTTTPQQYGNNCSKPLLVAFFGGSNKGSCDAQISLVNATFNPTGESVKVPAARSSNFYNNANYPTICSAVIEILPNQVASFKSAPFIGSSEQSGIPSMSLTQFSEKDCLVPIESPKELVLVFSEAVPTSIQYTNECTEVVSLTYTVHAENTCSAKMIVDKTVLIYNVQQNDGFSGDYEYCSAFGLVNPGSSVKLQGSAPGTVVFSALNNCLVQTS